jgi:hypothetical protein
MKVEEEKSKGMRKFYVEDIYHKKTISADCYMDAIVSFYNCKISNGFSKQETKRTDSPESLAFGNHVYASEMGFCEDILAYCHPKKWDEKNFNSVSQGDLGILVQIIEKLKQEVNLADITKKQIKANLAEEGREKDPELERCEDNYQATWEKVLKLRMYETTESRILDPIGIISEMLQEDSEIKQINNLANFCMNRK